MALVFIVVGAGMKGLCVSPLVPEDFVWACPGVGPEGEEEGWGLKAVRGSTSENEVRLFIAVGSTPFCFC